MILTVNRAVALRLATKTASGQIIATKAYWTVPSRGLWKQA